MSANLFFFNETSEVYGIFALKKSDFINWHKIRLFYVSLLPDYVQSTTMRPRRLLLLLCLALATSLQGQDTVLLKQLGVNVCRENPLHDFLSSPIQSVIINSGYFVYRQDTLRLTANSDSTLQTGHALLTHFYRKHHYDEEPYRIKCQRIRVKKEVNSRELRDILADIDRRPEQMPAITEFHITREDKERFADRVKKADYTDLMNDLIHSDIPDERWVEELFSFKEFYLSVPKHIDTLGAETMSNILYKDDHWFSTGGADWFKVQITNENGDSLLFSNVYYHGNYAWFLPWSVTYNGIHFRCYLPALSQWVNDIIPKKFYGKEWFDNASFLMQAAHYLWMESLKKR